MTALFQAIPCAIYIYRDYVAPAKPWILLVRLDPGPSAGCPYQIPNSICTIGHYSSLLNELSSSPIEPIRLTIPLLNMKRRRVYSDLTDRA